MEATASEASMMSANSAVMAREARGGGTSLRMALLMMPMVPSDPTMSPARLNPVTHLTVREPVFTRLPS